MGNAMAVLVVCCLFLLAGGRSPVRAADSGNDWNQIGRIGQGQRVAVIKTDLKRLEGAFAGSTADSIELAASRTTVSISRLDVMRVTTLGGRRPGAMKKGAIIGAAVGLAAGLGATLATGGADGLGWIVTAGNAGVGSAIGFGLGAVIPADTTVYRRPARVTGPTTAPPTR